MAAPLDSVLAELAHTHGVATSFYDWRGGERQVSADAVVAVLAAIGVDAATPESAGRALLQAQTAAWRRLLPVYVIARAGTAGRIAVHVRDGEPVSVEIETETGARIALAQVMVWVDPRDIDGELVGEATFEIPDDVQLGYHTLHAQSGQQNGRAALIVVPDRLVTPAGRHWGFMLQLYAVRSRASWGMGDLRDLAELATWSGAELGADFVLVNPLHAAAPVAPMEPSPYYPSSRRFVNPIYLRVDDVAEVASLPPADVAAAARSLRARNEIDEQLDRDAVWLAKRAILERAFMQRTDESRNAAFAQFVHDQGAALIDYATWCALAEVHGLPSDSWPVPLHDAHSPAVATFRTSEAERVEFHAWLQWLCSEQLAAVQQSARAAGMRLGVLHDLAVGVGPGGADAWALRDVLAQGVTLGAPADMYNQQGQAWNLPPWRPDTLAAAGFAPFRDLVRAALAHGGGLRVDHVIGLFRQWWVPAGALPADGTYLRLDHEALVGIVMLEAQRAGAVVVGEDPGNVEPWVRDYLRARGVFGTSILWFEHDDDGHPRRPADWRQLCLASVTTHDLPPAAGYLTGAHVELRHDLGLLERPIEEERALDESERVAWVHALDDAGLLSAGVASAISASSEADFATIIDPHIEGVVEALHAFVASTPAQLIGVYLPDVAGDRRPVNQPGTIDQYPNWRVPMSDAQQRPVLLEDLMASPVARRLAVVVAGRT